MSDAQPTQTTRLGRNWLIKTLLFLLLLVGFGCWGLADALYFYPKRGEMDAARRLKDYLDASAKAGTLTPDQLKLSDPAAAYADLRSREENIAARARVESPDGRAARVEETRLTWLDSLNRMWALRAEPRLVHTQKAAPGAPEVRYYFDMRTGDGYALGAGGVEKRPLTPDALLKVLSSATNTSNPVTPLSGFDMLTQWVFVVIGFGGGAWMLLTLVRAASKKYRWQSDTQTLTMPDGKTVTPAELKELDKRLWHKFFAVMHVKDGRAYKLDLLRYQPLEDWVLAMEKKAFPETATDENPADHPVASESAAPAE